MTCNKLFKKLLINVNHLLEIIIVIDTTVSSPGYNVDVRNVSIIFSLVQAHDGFATPRRDVYSLEIFALNRCLPSPLLFSMAYVLLSMAE